MAVNIQNLAGRVKFAITYKNLLQCLPNFGCSNSAAKTAVGDVTCRAVIGVTRVVPDIGSDQRARSPTEPDRDHATNIKFRNRKNFESLAPHIVGLIVYTLSI